MGGLSRGAAQTDKENSSGRDTYPFDDAEGSGASPCVDSKLELGERRAPAAEGGCSRHGRHVCGVSSCLRCALPSCACLPLPTADEGLGSSRKRSPLDFDEEPEGNG